MARVDPGARLRHQQHRRRDFDARLPASTANTERPRWGKRSPVWGRRRPRKASDPQRRSVYRYMDSYRRAIVMNAEQQAQRATRLQDR